LRIVSSPPPAHPQTAYTNVSTVPDQMISKSDFPLLQMPNNAMAVTDPNTGESGYRIGLEVFHQLHCLNMLRMATIPEYYTKVEWSDTNDKPEKVRAHLGKPFPFTFSTLSRVLIFFSSLQNERNDHLGVEKKDIH
jgi:hypothetical protein